MARIAPVAFVAAVMAYTASASVINFDSCPNGWSGSTLGDSDKVYCCPGSSHINNDDGYCCLDSSRNVVGADYSSEFANSFTQDGDIFSDTEDVFTRVKRADIPEPSCAATVNYKDPDYSSKVSSLSKSLHTTSTQGSDNKPASNTATTTGSGGGSTGTAQSNDAATTTSDNAAGAMPTAEILGGVLAVAAAFAM